MPTFKSRKSRKNRKQRYTKKTRRQMRRRGHQRKMKFNMFGGNQNPGLPGSALAEGTMARLSGESAIYTDPIHNLAPAAGPTSGLASALQQGGLVPYEPTDQFAPVNNLTGR